MASSKEQLQEFLDELPDDVELYMDKDGVTHSYGFKSHGDIRRKLGDEDWSKSTPGDEEGFITSEGRFVSRDLANRIGAEAGQCVRMDRKFLSSDVDKW